MLLANVLLRLLFVFDTSVNCYMFCSCGLLGSFLFATHVKSSYNVLSGRTMFNINRKGCLLLALRIFNAGPGCFVKIIARCVRYKRLTIVFVRFRQKAAVASLEKALCLVKTHSVSSGFSFLPLIDRNLSLTHSSFTCVTVCLQKSSIIGESVKEKRIGE